MNVSPKRAYQTSRPDDIVRPPSRLIAPERLPKLLRIVGVHRYDLYTWYTSWCLSPFQLFIFRLFCAIYLVMALCLGFKYGSHETAAQFFFFFTYISTFLLCCYFTLHAWHTFRVTRFTSSYFRRQANRASPWYLWLLQFLYSGCFVFHIIVVTIYWTILYPRVQQKALEGKIILGPVAIFLDVSVHVLPLIFMLVEIIVNNRFHVYAVEIFQTLLFMVIYTLWMWFGAFIFYLIRKEAWWVYPHFNFVGRNRAGLYYLIIFFLTLFGFGSMYLLHRLKQFCSGCIPPEPNPDEYEEQLKKYEQAY
jgi:hypothetical protein